MHLMVESKDSSLKNGNMMLSDLHKIERLEKNMSTAPHKFH